MPDILPHIFRGIPPPKDFDQVRKPKIFIEKGRRFKHIFGSCKEGPKRAENTFLKIDLRWYDPETMLSCLYKRLGMLYKLLETSKGLSLILHIPGLFKVKF